MRAAPGLEDPLQVALRMVIAATRGDDPGSAIQAAYEVLERTSVDVAVRASLHLAVIAALSGGSSRDGFRESASRLLTNEVFAKLVASVEVSEGA
jgi:hypothetical protein